MTRVRQLVGRVYRGERRPSRKRCPSSGADQVGDRREIPLRVKAYVAKYPYRTQKERRSIVQVEASLPPARLVIADDHSLVREGMRAMLASESDHLRIVAEATNGLEALASGMERERFSARRGRVHSHTRTLTRRKGTCGSSPFRAGGVCPPRLLPPRKNKVLLPCS